MSTRISATMIVGMRGAKIIRTRRSTAYDQFADHTV